MAAPKGNKFAIGNKGGRPPIYDNPEELTKKVVEYFEWCQGEYEEREGTRTITSGKGKDKSTIVETYTYSVCVRQPETPSITGMALFIGFNAKSTLYEYAEKEEFSDSIKRGLLVIESNYENGLWNDRPTGVIFALKNMGWSDKVDLNHGGQEGNPVKFINLGEGEAIND